MRRSQDLSAGNHSTNLQGERDVFQAGQDIVQAGRDVVLVGITYDQARQIALDVFEANFLRLVGVAQDVARDRAERIVRDFADKLQAQDPNGLESMRDPDMLRSLYAAQEGYACSGEADLEKSLVDLLVDRAGQVERDTKTHVLNQAIATLPRLTKSQRAALCAIFIVRHTRFVGPFEMPAFYGYMAECLVPFVDEVPDKMTDYGYMQSMGVGATSLGSITIEAALYEHSYGYFSKGFTREQAAAPWVAFLDDPDIFMPCLRDRQKLQIRARSLAEVRELAAKKDVPTLVTHAATGRMQEPEMKADLIANVPRLKVLFDKWDGPAKISNFEINAVGIAIGHAVYRQVTGSEVPLDLFLP